MSVEKPPGAAGEAPAVPSLVTANGATLLAPTRSNARSHLFRRVLPAVGLIALLIAGLVGFNVYWEGANFVSTDNAQVSGQTTVSDPSGTQRIAGELGVKEMFAHLAKSGADVGVESPYRPAPRCHRRFGSSACAWSGRTPSRRT